MGKRNGNFDILHGNVAGKAWRMQNFAMAAYIFCYFLISLSFLTEFPFVHSDEPWLSGLTRNMMEKGDLGVTESFFDLKPRYPHGIKVLFHLLQMPMLSLFGYGVFSFRLLSLLFGCIALILFYLLLKAVFPMQDPDGFRGGWRSPSGAVHGYPLAVSVPGYPLAGTVFLSLDVQFIYASHFARQEILLVCGVIACMLAVFKDRWLIAGLITGLSIGLHPNSFLIGTMCTAMLLPTGRLRMPRRDSGNRGQQRNGGNRSPRQSGADRMLRLEDWKPLLGYFGGTSAFAGIFIAISLSFDRGFFRHYWEYGSSEFDIGAPVTNKLAELPYFFEKIWYRVSGTYYVPDIRIELVLFILAAATGLLIFAGWKGASERPESAAAAILTGKGIIGMLAGMVIIGRYNQTGIIFLFPLFFVLILTVIDITVDLIPGCTGRKALYGKSGMITALAAAVVMSSYFNISPWLKFSYEDYLKEIAAAVTPENKVLANLNCEYYFDNGKLLDWRNLSCLKDAGLSVEDYIRKNKIEYIILSDEMDLIYSQRPVWNMIYGNLRYMEELRRFLDQNCTLVRSFQDNVYGVRIVQYMEPNIIAGGNGSGKGSAGDFTVQIFKVKDLS